MKKQFTHGRKLLLIGFLLLNTSIFAQDPNFYIYLCFGQSNMEGQGAIESIDRTVDRRFQVMEAINCSNLSRTKGAWYTATPPLCRCSSGLTPVDYFGRTMVANLPDSIRVGVINVSVAGCKIELFDKDNYQVYAATVESWMTSIITAYGGNPYAKLVEIAKLAQKDGVIKGILLHQGESNTKDAQWPTKVKGVYDNLITDLGLNAASVPLFAGEVVNADQEGQCASVNSIIATLPQTIPNSYVISSSGCTAASDKLHFNAAGYRKLGMRYAAKTLSLMGYTPVLVEPELYSYEAECTTVGSSWNTFADATASKSTYVTPKTGLKSISEVPANDSSAISTTFFTNAEGAFYVYARVKCPKDSDAFWVKMDNGTFEKIDGLNTNGWEWKKISSATLTAGMHSITFAYCKEGASIDKIYISNYDISPVGKGETAINSCTPVLTPLTPVNPLGVSPIDAVNGYALGQNYPNPFNEKTNISFEIANDTYVSLKVYNAFGAEVAELAGKEFARGKHIVEFDSKAFPKGIYFYTINADKFSASQKMILQGK